MLPLKSVSISSVLEALSLKFLLVIQTQTEIISRRFKMDYTMCRSPTVLILPKN